MDEGSEYRDGGSHDALRGAAGHLDDPVTLIAANLRAVAVEAGEIVGAAVPDVQVTVAIDHGEAMARLEAIVHPLVGNAIAQAAAVAAQAGQRLIVFDIPLLTESPRWARQLDAVLVVDCREESQVARVQARNGLTEDAIRAIMATQSSRAVRRAAADFVVYNDALTLSDLQTKARQVAAGFGL